MLTLPASIACSVAVSILLKLAPRRSWRIGQLVAANYGMAAGLCLALLSPDPAQLPRSGSGWAVLCALGVLLPTVFLAMASAVKQAGIVLSDAAQRLSLILPLAASFLFFGESLSLSTLAGIGLAFAALACLLHRPVSHGTHAASRRPGTERLSAAGRADPLTLRTAGWLAAAALLAVWLGYGAIDILFKQLARTGAAFPASLLAAFVLAGLAMLAGLLATRSRWHAPSLGAGLVLGSLNFGNIYFYIRAHQAFPGNPSLVFTAMNIGVIALGTLAGVLLFKEAPSRVNYMGVALAALAVIALAVGRLLG